MENTAEELKKVERKLTAFKRRRIYAEAFWLSGDNEIKYLMNGHATELIDTVSLPRVYDSDAEAKIYGVVGKDRGERRYVWIYLYHSHFFWKCYSLQHAFEIIEELKEYCELEKRVYRLQQMMPRKQKKKEISNN